MLDRSGGVDEVARLELGAALDQLAVGERLECFSEFGRCVNDQRLERDDRRTACFDRGIASDLDLADHLGSAVGTLRDGGRDPCEYRPRGHLRVDRVILPVVPSLSPVAMIDFDDPDGVAANETRQPDTVRPGALDPKGLDSAERARPGHQLGVAAPLRGVGARMRAGLRASNRRARHLPMRYETGLPSSVIRFRTLHASTASRRCPDELRARRQSPTIDVYRKNAFSTRAC